MYTDTSKINYLNVLLMLVSLGLAWYKPFEVFVFAFLIVGPLHYLTEISWLDKKNYFAFSREQFLLFVPICLFITLAGVFRSGAMGKIAVALICASLVYAMVATRQNKPLRNLLIFAATVIFIIITGLNTSNTMGIAFGVLLPTIVHVLVFTYLFMLVGLQKEKGISGYLAALVYPACAALLLSFNPFHNTARPDNYFIRFYRDTANLNKTLSDMLGIGEINNFDDVFIGDAAHRIMGLVAFAYCYHYLNWFSKTEIIGWHRVSKKRLFIIGIIWIALLVFYYFYPTPGLHVILFLSLMHVMLEFPLNVISIKQLLGIKQ